MYVRKICIRKKNYYSFRLQKMKKLNNIYNQFRPTHWVNNFLEQIKKSTNFLPEEIIFLFFMRKYIHSKKVSNWTRTDPELN